MTDNNAYAKRPLWQWVIIYLLIGGLVYGAIYFLVLRRNGGYNYMQSQQNQNQQTAPVAQNAVTIQNMAFSPATMTIKVGDSITWTNQDLVNHTATADDNSFDTGTLSNGQSKTITFAKAGTYKYHCTIHPKMLGTIIVQ